jgi:hypothetical protein
VYFLFGDNSRQSKVLPSSEISFSVDKGKESGIISVANRSNRSNIGQSLDIVAGMIISDIVARIIIFRI